MAEIEDEAGGTGVLDGTRQNDRGGVDVEGDLEEVNAEEEEAAGEEKAESLRGEAA